MPERWWKARCVQKEIPQRDGTKNKKTKKTKKKKKKKKPFVDKLFAQSPLWLIPAMWIGRGQGKTTKEKQRWSLVRGEESDEERWSLFLFSSSFSFLLFRSLGSSFFFLSSFFPTLARIFLSLVLRVCRGELFELCGVYVWCVVCWVKDVAVVCPFAPFSLFSFLPSFLPLVLFLWTLRDEVEGGRRWVRGLLLCLGGQILIGSLWTANLNGRISIHYTQLHKEESLRQVLSFGDKEHFFQHGPFFFAALKEIVEGGREVSQPDDDGWSPLHYVKLIGTESLHYLWGGVRDRV